MMPGAMRAIERRGDLEAPYSTRLFGRERALGKPRRQRLAFEVFHHQEVDALVAADVVQGADVRMVQRRDGARLALEAGRVTPDRRRLRRAGL